MNEADPELVAMSQILHILEGLADAAARIRVAEWVHQRTTGQPSKSPHGDAKADAGDAQHGGSRPVRVGGVDGHESGQSFVQTKHPRTKTERFVCLLFWAAGPDGREVPIKTLDELNRLAQGDAFSDASSLAQHAVAKGYARRATPGHVAITFKGRDFVASLPAPTEDITARNL